MSTPALALPLPAAAAPRLLRCRHTFRSFDGTTLCYRAWHLGAPAAGAVVLFHGGHEHSGRFDELARALVGAERSVYAWDARGHGRSPGARGGASHFMDYVRDADCFVRHLDDAHGVHTKDIAVVAHSVGSVVVATWLHDYAPPVRAAVLGSPAFEVKLYAPFAVPALALWQRIRPEAVVRSYVRPGMLTHDAEEAEVRRHDPLISPDIGVRVLTSLFATSARVIAGANSIGVPTLVLCAGSDWVVRQRAQQRFFSRLGATVKQFVTLPGFYHEVFHEAGRVEPIAHAKRFIDECFAARPRAAAVAPTHDDDRYASLLRPSPWWSPKRHGYAAVRGLMGTVGRLSDGVRRGLQVGFDAGWTLDYVYENRARGRTALGRLVDRVYLDAAGWRGIRERAANLRRLLAAQVRARLAAGGEVHVLDVAAGPGRYLQDLVVEIDDPRLVVTCRDFDPDPVATGRRLAVARGLWGMRYETGDAFDPGSLRTLVTRPDIAVVAGLYELFADDDAVLRSLRGLHDVLRDDGVLLYTNQPHHPQREFIARVLRNRDGAPWVMRLRSQAEMNALARAAGFEPAQMAIDDHGIFCVTVAVKRARA